MNSATSDERLMQVALEEAARGRYSAAPNPAVGCVLARDGNIVARGYHRRAGEAHAEAMALAAAGDAARGCTAYVTLEPCNHHGRTPPCSAALIRAGVSRVVYALADPNPQVNGGGAAQLRAAGIRVEGGVLERPAAALIPGFLFRAAHARPRIRVKLGMSLDAAAAMADGESQWITGASARADVQRLRAESCAVLTGIGTLLADDARLTVRDVRFDLHGRQPTRIVLDSQARLPATAATLAEVGDVVVLTTNPAPPAALLAAGACCHSVSAEAGVATVPLSALSAFLSAGPYNDVLVEAGPTLAGSLLAAGLYDELLVYVAPKMLGCDARPALAVPSAASLAEAHALRLLSTEVLGDDVLLRYAPRR